MTKLDIRDWLVVVLVAFILVVATIYLFTYPEPMVFATWATVVGTVTSAYHWIVLKDQKEPDK